MGDINALKSITKGYSCKGVRVAVVDGIVDGNHQDLIVTEEYSVGGIGSVQHCTGVAGIIRATGFNGVGIRGITYGS